MSEQVIAQEETVAVSVPANPFDDSTWSTEPIVAKPVAETIVEKPATEEAPVTTEVKPVEVDYSGYIKEKFGYDSEEALANDIGKLKQEKVQTEFANEDSKLLYEYLIKGKKEDALNLLQKEAKLNGLLNSNVDSVAVASEIIKTALQSKYSDLTEEEVQRKFEKQFSIPEKPTQGFDESDEDYAQTVARWERQKADVEKDMMIEAKIVRKELQAIELKLPDISNEKAERQPTQEELLEVEKLRKAYEVSLEAATNSFNGFSITAKSEDANLPVAFVPTEAEKVALKQKLYDFDSNSFLENRWLSKDGVIDAQKAMSDIYLLENYETILQKVANESAAKMLEHVIKTRSNISLNTGAGRQADPVLTSTDEFQKQVEAIWSA